MAKKQLIEHKNTILGSAFRPQYTTTQHNSTTPKQKNQHNSTQLNKNNNTNHEKPSKSNHHKRHQESLNNARNLARIANYNKKNLQAAQELPLIDS